MIERYLKQVYDNVSDHGVTGLAVTAKQANRLLREKTVDPVDHYLARRGSENVYNREWDVLLILDCARKDMMRQVQDEYSFIDDVGEHVSPGTHSPEWMQFTFTRKYREEIAETLHVTANTYSSKYLDEADFLHLEEVWRDGWSEEHLTVPPRTVTGRAVSLYRELYPDNMIVHYMQPHTPFIPFPEVNSRNLSKTPWESKEGGKTAGELFDEGYSRSEIWDFYIENLRVVLDDVEVLLSSIDADTVVISADHGEALGENGVWGHPRGARLDCLRTVPWCVTSATDTGEYDPLDEAASSESTSTPGLSVEEKLRSLGYRE